MQNNKTMTKDKTPRKFIPVTHSVFEKLNALKKQEHRTYSQQLEVLMEHYKSNKIIFKTDDKKLVGLSLCPDCLRTSKNGAILRQGDCAKHNYKSKK